MEKLDKFEAFRSADTNGLVTVNAKEVIIENIVDKINEIIDWINGKSE